MSYKRIDPDIGGETADISIRCRNVAVDNIRVLPDFQKRFLCFSANLTLSFAFQAWNHQINVKILLQTTKLIESEDCAGENRM